MARQYVCPEKEAARDARVEDVIFMAETGESLEGVARRLGINKKTLVQFLGREGLEKVQERFKINCPDATPVMPNKRR